VLEAIVRLLAGALGDEEVRAGEPVEPRLEGEIVDLAYGAQQRVSTQHLECELMVGT
jgi:hypothetical protein